MTQIILEIPENRLKFVTELLQQLGIEHHTSHELSGEQIAFLEKRMAICEENKAEAQEWDTIKNEYTHLL